MTDIVLQQRIVDELQLDPEVNPAHIGVIVDKGVVTLTGHVTTYAEKLAAESAVRRVRGVRALAEEVEVRPPNHKRTADDEIAARVADIFEWDARIPKDDIIVSVDNGWVRLEGEVTWPFQRDEAQAQITKLSGLVGIVNNIKVRMKPKLTDIRRHIEEAFQRNALIDADALTVQVDDAGRVSLKGTVHSWSEQAAAERATWSVPGVTRLESHIRIGS
ncbi:MAG: BON domain-containing protein [Alphaproteobacteria bacterium]|nr:BON domain-containing protein [Alphaproteobacteria bacterium]